MLYIFWNEIIPLFVDYGQPEDIGYGYQKAALSSELASFKEHYPYLSNQELEKLMLDYLERGRPKDNYYIYGKTKKSVFRERDESEYPEKLQKLSPEQEEYGEDALYKTSPFRERFREVESKANERHINNADMEYLSALNTLWEQYQHKQDNEEQDNEDSNDIGMNDNIQLSDEDIAAILSYFEDKNDDDPRLLEELDQMNENSPYVYLKNKHHSKNTQKRMWREGAFESHPGYGNSERILIKKRALKTIPDLRKKKQPPQDNRQRDNNNNNNENKELTQIFGEGNKKNGTTKPPASDVKTSTQASTVAQTQAPVTTEKPIVMRKKSVDWSNYFGVDKRKKKPYKRNSADNWPVEQYMHHNEINNIEAKDIDTKFRDMEDMILDQVIKYTGAHEGIRNPEQLHRVKQKIMEQLATAYNLEKMRHTLNEYKSTIDYHNIDRNSKYLVSYSY